MGIYKRGRREKENKKDRDGEKRQNEACSLIK